VWPEKSVSLIVTAGVSNNVLCHVFLLVPRIRPRVGRGDHFGLHTYIIRSTVPFIAQKKKKRQKKRKKSKQLSTNKRKAVKD
jgi:hypothetical protein